MKKNILLLTAILCTVLGYSQGINFEKGSWKEVLEKAKQTNKPIFVDVYTSWCGPCKMMNKDIFPLESVGSYFNNTFINYQIDAEKGEGVSLAKLYNVNAYPTYVFINPKGEFVYKFMGSMAADEFIKKAKEALVEYNNPKPIAEWEKEYLTKKNDPNFLLEYMNKRVTLSLPNADLLNEYIQLIPEKQRNTELVMEFYKKDGYFLDVTSAAYQNLKLNETLFLEKKLPVGNMMGSSVVTTISKAAKTKDVKLLNAAIAAYDILSEETKAVSSKEALYMVYYKESNDNENYVKYACQLSDKWMKNTNEVLVEKSKASVAKFELDAKAGKYGQLDAENYGQGKAFFEQVDKAKTMRGLNENAWEVFTRTEDKNILNQALTWSKRSLELAPDNAQYLDTNANLLLKLGFQKEAIEQEEKALALTNKDDAESYGKIQENLRKIKAGEKTW